jgi:hypothetical protein
VRCAISRDVVQWAWNNSVGSVGIFFPILWLIGAVLPPRPGSQLARKQAAMR